MEMEHMWSTENTSYSINDGEKNDNNEQPSLYPNIQKPIISDFN